MTRVARLLAGLATAFALLTACDGAPPSLPNEEDLAFADADSLREFGHYAESLPLYRALRDSFAAAGDSALHWRAGLGWTEALLRTGRRDSARAAIAEQFVLARGNPSREGWTRLVNGLLLLRFARLDSAGMEADSARRIAAAIGDRHLEARGLSVMGTAHSLGGRYREAAEAAERAVVIHRQRRDPHALAIQLNNLAVEYRHLGRLSDAERLLREALAIADSGQLWRLRMLVNGNYSNVRSSAGDLGGALEMLGNALTAAERLDAVQSIAMANNQMADLYRRAGNQPAARMHVRRALDASGTAGNAYGRLIALHAMGDIELTAAQPDSAERWLVEALAAADSGGFGRQRAGVRASLSRLALARRDAVGALRWADAALAIADSLGDPEAEFEALEVRAAALEGAHSPQAAGAWLRAIHLLESWRGRLAMGDLRMGIAEPRLGAYEGAVRVLLASGRAAEAFHVAERARARQLLELMADRDVRRSARTTREDLRRRLRERYEAAGAMRDAALRDSVERVIARLTDSLATIEAAERARDPLAPTRLVAPDELPELQAELLPGGRRLLAYFWGDSAVYGWAIDADSLHAVRLGNADTLSALVEFLRGSIETPSGNAWIAPARRAWQTFVAPLGVRRASEILVIPDGPLAYVPLETFVPDASGESWGAEQRIVYGPSASVLLALARAPERQDWPRAMLALGDPGAPTGSLTSLFRGDGSDRFGSLPYAAEEARAIGTMFRDSGADILIGSEATLARWMSFDPSSYRFLHFATHARVDERQPERTHLVMSGAPLDLADIRALALRAELVTLSACETALGRRVRGEGVIGLPHAFLSAGAQGAVVTLWRIGDRSAADFMRDFYADVQRGTAPADALLRARQARIRSRGAEAHPAVWAPFILVGGHRG